MNLNKLIRLNYIRNHYLRFGIKGILFYYKIIFSKKTKIIIFKHSEFKTPVFLRTNSSDIDAFYQVLFNLAYKFPIKEEPKVIIDLGANVGFTSIYFLNKFPKSKIIAVEPDNSNYKMLKMNTENYSNFFSYNKGIWNKPSYLEIKDNGLGSWGLSVHESISKSEDSIETITLNQIIENHSLRQIDILKIDIEGSEIELFSSNFEMWLPLTKIIVIELHDWMREGCSKQFFTTLVKYNFELSHKGENLICYMKTNA